MAQYESYEVHFTGGTPLDPVLVSVYGIEGDGQMAYLAGTELGPFCTHLEAVQWLTRALAKHGVPLGG
jgi:hypothetical protein